MVVAVRPGAIPTCPVGVSGLPVCYLLSPACDDVLEVVAFNASSWWHEVNALGQDRAWGAERAALGTTGHSWAAEPGAEAAWLELDLGTRRNVTGESWPSEGDNSCLCPHATLTTVLPLISFTDPHKTALGTPAARDITPRMHWSSLCHGFTGANWDAECTIPPRCSCPPFVPLPPSSVAISRMNKLILCSCIWCQ